MDNLSGLMGKAISSNRSYDPRSAGMPNFIRPMADRVFAEQQQTQVPQGSVPQASVPPAFIQPAMGRISSNQISAQGLPAGVNAVNAPSFLQPAFAQASSGSPSFGGAFAPSQQVGYNQKDELNTVRRNLFGGGY